MGKLSYSVVVEWDEAKRVFTATVPAFSISTYGSDRKEALEKAKEAILVTIEGLSAAGQEVPQGDAGAVEIFEMSHDRSRTL